MTSLNGTSVDCGNVVGFTILLDGQEYVTYYTPSLVEAIERFSDEYPALHGAYQWLVREVRV